MYGPVIIAKPDAPRPEPVPAAVVVEEEPPSGPLVLGERGEALKAELLSLGEPAPGDSVLIEEAARLADRLDILARILRGENHPWLVIQLDLRKNLLAETRQSTLALRQVVSTIQARHGVKGAGVEPAAPETDPLDQLAAKRAERRANAAGS